MIDIKIIIKYLIISVGLLLASFAKANTLEFTQKPLLSSDFRGEISTVVLLPHHPHQFISFSTFGDVGLIKQSASTYQPLLNAKHFSDDFQRLTALALHPNFAQEEKIGYATFYSAHIESASLTNRSMKLTVDEDKHMPFEAVIFEWQLSLSSDSTAILTDSRREVLRVPLPDSSVSIPLLSFNPYIKSWQKGYGQLFAVISAEKHYPNHPLFSGALLRINPQKFGLRQYTVPPDNILFSSNDSPSEVVSTGLGNVLDLTWLKEDENQFVFVEQLKKTTQLRKATLGDNFLLQPATDEHLLQQDIIFSNSIYLKNPQLSNEHFPLIFLEKTSDNWLLKASAITANISSNPIATIDFSLLNANAKPQLLINSAKQIIIVDLANKSLLATNNTSDVSESPVQTTPLEEQKEPSNSLYFIVILLMIAGAIVAVLFRQDDKYKNAKKLLRSHYATFTIDKEKAELLLFKRHEKTASARIAINNIMKNELYLNGELISTIDKNSPFSNKAEARIDQTFKEEKRHKMVDNKVRKVVMIIHLQNQETKQLCLYLREGNQRLTKARFEQVQQQVIDWCWLISHQLCKGTTEKRVIKPKPVEPTQKQRVTHTSIQSAAAKANKQETTPTHDSSQHTEKAMTNHKAPKHQDAKPAQKVTAKNEDNDEVLINSLNKLLELKSQGFLSEEEFNRSKARIIDKLSS
ncbi:hypothetical protein [Thalassotalea sp. PP2-459]|uniref:hypothetical protein n=1 Tax=Thalassotalea sp. PP2-459 TaxID=1742724 RepID=UPI0009428C4F|nr:hypothetical protein [Thalassotalea sp. PP2-459]OKY26678.1 hypothetical protein BI291_01410 [Thalassotalea sp. PP2-459]